MTETWLAADWMQTFTGKAFRPLDPDPAEICIEDIAHALSMLCRYNGHVTRFYSVAEHCYRMSEAVAPENALWALLHDSTEAYLGDMIRPLKRQMPGYVEAEQRLMAAICLRFGLDPEQPAEVKEADTRILMDERRVLLGKPPRPWVGEEVVETLGVYIHGWTPSGAEQAYLRRFADLTRTGRG